MIAHDNRAVADLHISIALLTRLPLPKLPETTVSHRAAATWSYPLAGLAIAAVAISVGGIALGVGLAPGTAAALALATQITATGAMHEDGLADTADGLWGGWNRKQRLAIMKDSAIGTYGVIALILSIGMRWIALTALLPTGPGPLIAAATLSRGLLPAMMALMPHARTDGLSVAHGRPELTTALFALGLGIALAFAGNGWATIPAGLAAAGLLAILGRISQTKTGGQTGDILGAAQQLAETAILVTLAAQL